MRVSTALLALFPIIAFAQEQKPLGENLQAWFETAKSYIPPSIYSPVAAGSAKVAAINVEKLTVSNWRPTLRPTTTANDKGPDVWMVYITGGNTSCYGQCDGVDKAWNESAALFSKDKKAPHLAFIDCDEQAILCSMWAAGPPAIWHIQFPIPQADQSTPATTIHVIPLNTTTTTAREIEKIHSAKGYEKVPVYEGAFHPFDGHIARFGLTEVVGYVLFGFAKIPSWAFMLIMSLVSRGMMSRRTGQATQQPPRGGAPPANQ